MLQYFDMTTEKEKFNIDTLSVLGDFVQPNFRDEFLKLLQKESFGAYQEFLVKSLLENPTNYTTVL